MQWSYDQCIENYKEDEEEKDVHPTIKLLEIW
jgi:hypothetical protein